MKERFTSLEDEEKKKGIIKKLTSGRASTLFAKSPQNIVLCGQEGVLDLPYDTTTAIAAGNTVILKPTQQSPDTACKLAELILQAGLPPQLVQLVLGSGPTLGD